VWIVCRVEIRELSDPLENLHLGLHAESRHTGGYKAPPKDRGLSRPCQARRLPEFIVQRCDARRLSVVACHGGFL
jgi:hypothetical protein